MEQTCYNCKSIKNISFFRKDKRIQNGYSNQCKDCANKYRYNYSKTDKSIKQRREYFQKNKEKLKNKKDPLKEKLWMLKHRYNLTKEQYINLLETQNFSCAICFTEENKLPKKLFIDHCHKTGKIRGLLCHNCNSSLGLLKENIVIINSLLNYIKSYE